MLDGDWFKGRYICTNYPPACLARRALVECREHMYSHLGISHHSAFSPFTPLYLPAPLVRGNSITSARLGSFHAFHATYRGTSELTKRGYKYILRCHPYIGSLSSSLDVSAFSFLVIEGESAALLLIDTFRPAQYLGLHALALAPAFGSRIILWPELGMVSEFFELQPRTCSFIFSILYPCRFCFLCQKLFTKIPSQDFGSAMEDCVALPPVLQARGWFTSFGYDHSVYDESAFSIFCQPTRLPALSLDATVQPFICSIFLPRNGKARRPLPG